MYSNSKTSIDEYEKANRLETYFTQMQASDKTAFASLYEETRVCIYSFALSIVKNPKDAEDILQDTYLKVYESVGSYRKREKPMAWMLTITRNLSLMKIRKNGKEKTISNEEWDHLTSKEPLSKEERMVLKAALAILSDEERQIVTLYIAGLKHREIASVLNLPLGTILSKYHRALGKLKSQMIEEDRNER